MNVSSDEVARYIIMQKSHNVVTHNLEWNQNDEQVELTRTNDITCGM